MARKGWLELSPAYRRRLQAGGVSQRQYEAGASLRSARGHKNTPERPVRARKIAPNKVQITGGRADLPDSYERFLRREHAAVIKEGPPPARGVGVREYRDRDAKRAAEYVEAIGNPNYIQVYFWQGQVIMQIQAA